MNNNIEKLLESIENIKEKINDNEYKNLVEQLNDVYKEEKTTVVYEFVCSYYDLKQVPYVHKKCNEDENSCCHACKKYGNEAYVLKYCPEIINESVIIDKNSDVYKFLNNNSNKFFYDNQELRRIFYDCVNDDSFVQTSHMFQKYVLDEDEDEDCDFMDLFVKLDEGTTLKIECLTKPLFNFIRFNEIKYMPY